MNSVLQASNLSTEMLAHIQQAVDDGEYVSTDEVIREALQQWSARRQLMQGELAALKADIHQGLADIKAGQVYDFDTQRIITQGKQRLAARSN